ncbi:MAG: KH domain-containing protein [Dehalococcoidales bacterium]|nr:KH domain-containing protein [Dehalococcoidales bacterium]
MSISEEETNITDVARSVLETLIEKIGLAASVVLQTNEGVGEEDAPAPVVVDIEGDDLGILIGRRGQTLACLQFILRLIVGHQTKTWLPIVIDVEGYKQSRFEKLQALACRLAEQVKDRRKPFTLEPMPAYERRVIHLALAEHPDVTTESIGLGEARKVVIRPK